MPFYTNDYDDNDDDDNDVDHDGDDDDDMVMMMNNIAESILVFNDFVASPMIS